MKVRDLMSPSPTTVSPNTPVLEAREPHGQASLPPSAGRRGRASLAGVITDRDIRLNLPSQATSLSVWELNYLLARLTVGAVMTKAVVMVEPARAAVEAARLMLDHKIGCLAVTEGDRVVGIVTESDFLRAFVLLSSAPPAAH